MPWKICYPRWAFLMNEIIVGIADAKTAHDHQVLVTYALGSCVGICLYETNRKLAGMVHILLPTQVGYLHMENAYKFADSGITRLIDRMITLGADKKKIIAKIAGGAEMFQTLETKTDIGMRNIAAVKNTLHLHHIPLIAEDTGSTYGRSIWFSSSDGSLKIKTVKHGIQII